MTSTQRTVLLAFAGMSLAWSPAQAGPTDEYHKALKAAKQALDDARRELGAAEGELTKAKKELTKAEDGLNDAVKTARQNADAAKVAQRLAATAKRAEESGRTATENLKAKAGKQAERVREELDRLLKLKVTLLDSHWTIDGEFDPCTSAGFAWAKVPFAKLTQDQIAGLLAGHVSLPELNLSELPSLLLGLRVEEECDWDEQVRAVYAKADKGSRVYVSSRGLAELLSTEHVIDAAWKAGMSGGATITGSTDEVARGFGRELTSVYAFLTDALGDQAAKDALPALAEAILLKKELKLPAITVRPFKAKMTYTGHLVGVSEVLKMLGSEAKPKGLNPSWSFDRIGFVLTVAKAKTPALIDLLKVREAELPKDLTVLLADKLSKEALALIKPALGKAVAVKMPFEREVLDALKKLDLERLPVKDGMVDLLADRPLKEQLDKQIGRLKLGSEGTAEVTQFLVNTHTGQITIRYSMRVLYQGSLQDGLKAAGEKVEAVSGKAAEAWSAAKDKLNSINKGLDEQQKRLRGLETDLRKNVATAVSAKKLANSARSAQQAAARTKGAAEGVVRKWEDKVKTAQRQADDASAAVAGLEEKIRKFVENVFAPLIPRKWKPFK